MNKKIVGIISSVCVCAVAVVFISITRFKELNIAVDGQIINHRSACKNVGQAIEELDINLSDNDKVNYNLDDKLVKEMEIVITRVEVKEESVVEEIPFTTEYSVDYRIKAGEEVVSVTGVNGSVEKHYSVTYEDDKESTRVLLDEAVLEEPVNEVVKQGIFDENSLTVCVNKERMLESTYEPSDMRIPNVKAANSTSKLYMREEAATALEDMFEGASNDGLTLYATSGYRSYSTQKSIYNPYSGYSAPPGASEHQLGLAMDLTLPEYGSKLYVKFAYTDEGKWVKENAHKYGFIIRYLEGKEDITGYNYEPWHIRYVGTELAKELYEKQITLEEYYDNK